MARRYGRSPSQTAIEAPPIARLSTRAVTNDDVEAEVASSTVLQAGQLVIVMSTSPSTYTVDIALQMINFFSQAMRIQPVVSLLSCPTLSISGENYASGGLTVIQPFALGRSIVLLVSPTVVVRVA